MGKYSNVILYNYDTNIILGCAHNVGAEKAANAKWQAGCRMFIRQDDLRSGTPRKIRLPIKMTVILIP